ncbi:hypothetical protein EHS25_000586 [Saitozyma podzolica]|uniref:Beta-xylosidase C-terminal Concanavalin A-like domain-containing protein n=1 Tax=Saitozyma podzolica TaxID=1890683 RepID=A0A427YWQ0_9TREE|nr:hypothetical protein EHS25_000586 [Saitozyma podzolica]
MSTSTSVSASYRNPILPGFNPDPSIIRVGPDYFLITSTFEYFPGIPLYHSTDLINWTLLGHVLSRRSQLDLRACEPGMGVFAPTIRFHKGRFYVTVCAFHRKSRANEMDPMIGPRGFYVSTTDIWDTKSWSDPTYYDVLGIDQDLFFDTDDRVYLSVSTWIGDNPGSPYITEIDLDSGRSLGPLTLLRRGEVGNKISEGSHIFKKDGWYYLLTAEGGTEVEHQEWVCRSKTGPFGPWEVGPTAGASKGAHNDNRGDDNDDNDDRNAGKDPIVVNPMVYNGDHPLVRQTGHMDLVEGHDGRWWAVFLAVRPVWDGDEPLLSQLGRETFLAPVEWREGWPIVNRRQPISLDGAQDAGLPRAAERYTVDLSFKPGMDIHSAGWYHLRTPQKREYSLTHSPGHIALFGGPYDIRVDESVTMLLQKQTSFRGTWDVRLEYLPEREGEEAGTTVWWSKWCFASVGIRGVQRKRQRQHQHKHRGHHPKRPETETVERRIRSEQPGEGEVEEGEDGGKGVEREVVFRYPDPEGDEFKYTFFVGPSPSLSTSTSSAPPTSASMSKPMSTSPSASSSSPPAPAPASLREVGSIPSRSLVRTRPFDSIFTGTHLGIYAMGTENQGSRSAAVFGGIKWEGVRAGGE